MQAQSRTYPLILLLAAVAALVPLSVGIYLPGLPAIALDLGASTARVQMSVALWLAGLCVGSLVGGPMSDHYGRRPLLLAALALYGLSSLGCWSADNVAELLICRVAQGLGAGAALVVVRAVACDVFAPGQAQRALSWIHALALLTALAAPVVGTWLMALDGWHSLFGVLCLLGLGCAVAVWLRLEESHGTDPDDARPLDTAHAGRRAGRASLGALVTAYLRVLSDRQAVSLLLCTAFSYGGVFAFVTASPFVFIDNFGFSPWAFSAVAALGTVGALLMVVLDARRAALAAPLTLLKFAAWVTAGTGLVLTGTSLLGIAVPGVIVVGALAYVGISAVIGARCTASLRTLFAREADTASRLALAIQLASAAVFSWLVSAFADGTAMPMCVAMGIGGAGCLLGFWGLVEDQEAGEIAGR